MGKLTPHVAALHGQAIDPRALSFSELISCIDRTLAAVEGTVGTALKSADRQHPLLMLVRRARSSKAVPSIRDLSFPELFSRIDAALSAAEDHSSADTSAAAAAVA